MLHLIRVQSIRFRSQRQMASASIYFRLSAHCNSDFYEPDYGIYSHKIYTLWYYVMYILDRYTVIQSVKAFMKIENECCVGECITSYCNGVK